MIIITKLLVIAVPLAILGIIITNLFSNRLQGTNTGSVQGKKTQVTASNSGSNNKYLGNSINKLQQVAETTRNKEIESQITEIVDKEEQADENIDSSIKNMEGRPGYLKFIIGEDYKNAGQVRSEVVHLRNQISKLNRIQEKAGASESSAIAESTATFQAELTAIETKLYESLQGFSLFGWLSKLLSGFTLTPSPSPSVTPEVLPSESPIPTSEPTVTPTKSATPTTEPTATP